MANWPTQLPQMFEAASYGFAPQSGVIRTSMDTGPDKVRRRFSAVTKVHSGSMIVSKTDLETYFFPFFHTTIVEGTLEFNFQDPLDDLSTIAVRFVTKVGKKPYAYKQYTPETVRLAFILEEIP